MTHVSETINLLSASALSLPLYLDPAAGSMILQLIVGGIAGAAIFLKMTWHRITGRGVSRKSEEVTPAADSKQSD